MAITNTAANTALRFLSSNQSSAASSMGKLSSGTRIVKASDDAAGLAVGTKLKADVTALKQAKNNAGQATSMLQVADGGLSQVSDILLRMKSLSVQAQSGSVTDKERGYINKEFAALTSQIDDIADQTKFSGTNLLSDNGTDPSTADGTGLDFQVGVLSSEKITVKTAAVDTTTLGINADKVDTAADATTASDNLDTAIETVIEGRADVGAQISRFEYAGANLATSIENLDAAKSTIMDVDMASEMSAFSAKNVQTQASVAMLAQANQLPQQMLRLLN